MATDVLTLSEAAESLDIPGRELVQLVYERAIRHVMVKGIPHITAEALDEYRSRA